MSLTSEIRLAVAAGGRGEKGERTLPLDAGEGTLRYGHLWVGAGPRPLQDPIVSYVLSAPRLSADEEATICRILGDDPYDAPTETTSLCWRLGPVFQDVAERAAAHSAAWLRPVNNASVGENDSSSVMRWVARQLDNSAVSEAVELDGSSIMINLALGDSEKPAIAESALGRGIHLLPVNAAARLLRDTPELAASGVVYAITVLPRGEAQRWRDTNGHMLYILPPGAPGLRVVSSGLLTAPEP